MPLGGKYRLIDIPLRCWPPNRRPLAQACFRAPWVWPRVIGTDHTCRISKQDDAAGQLQRPDRVLVQAVAELHGPPTANNGWPRPVDSSPSHSCSQLERGSTGCFQPVPGGGVALITTGVAYSFLLIASHEMVHGTFLGQRSLDFGLGCLLSWPMAWPFATYAWLHRLHHRWNGVDARHPDRTQSLPQDPLAANPFGRWLKHHPFAVRCLLLGAVVQYRGSWLNTTGYGRRLNYLMGVAFSSIASGNWRRRVMSPVVFGSML